jgi:hypothetical protein
VTGLLPGGTPSPPARLRPRLSPGWV